MPLHPSLTSDDAIEMTTTVSMTSSGWPPAPKTITHKIGGALADRVRSRFGKDTDATVMLTEETTYGGYSYWTQDNSTVFTVTCDGATQTFHPRSQMDWREGLTSGYDSVYARFDAWLSVMERPIELFMEWFEKASDLDGTLTFLARPESLLISAVNTLSYRGRVDHVTLTGVSDGYGRLWTLAGYGPADPSGERPARVEHTVEYTEGEPVTETVAKALLLDLTDRLMPGRER